MSQDLPTPPLEIDALEERLANSQQPERLPILIEIVEHLAGQRSLTHLDPRAYVDEAAMWLEQTPDDDLELRLLRAALEAFAFRRQLEPARSSGFRLRQRANARGDPELLAFAHKRLGDVERYASNYPEALHNYELALPLFEELGDFVGIGDIHNNSAIIYEKQGQLTDALASYLASRDAAEKANDLMGIALNMQNLGTLQSVLGHEEAAEAYLLEAIELGRQGDLPSVIADSQIELAALRIRQGRAEEALQLLPGASRYFEQYGPPSRLAWISRTLGDAELLLNRPESALRNYQRALRIAEDVDSLELQILCRLQIAKLHQHQGNLTTASQSLEVSLSLAQQIGHEEHRFHILQTLADTYAQSGHYQKAYQALQASEALHQEILGAQSRRTLTEMQTRFEAAQREKEIARLEREDAQKAMVIANQRSARQFLLMGFALLLGALAVLFYRYRVKTREQQMKESVRQTRELNRSLREVDAWKDEVLANTSHELRTPLYGVQGLAESLLDEASLTDAGRYSVTTIIHSVGRLSRLVNDILDFSKLRDTQLAMVLEPVELHALADIVLTLSKPLAADKDLTLINAISPDLPPAHADAHRVQQILQNLVGNAIKFTPEGHVQVAAHVDGDRLEVRVIDSGIGIAEEDQQRIFESFVQAETSTERTYGGTGLGLAICRHLVELHGGRLWVESTVSQGSTFVFTLPSIDQTTALEPSAAVFDAVEQEPLLPLPANDVTQKSLGRIPKGDDSARILVVDDEPLVQQVLTRHLTTHGHRVVVVGHGQEALDLLREDSFDLILLDVMMPRMSGYEVCREIRTHHSTESLPIIFLSAKGSTSDRIAGFREGGNDYLIKPIARDELLARLDLHLRLLEAHRLQALEVKQLRGLLPICSNCHRIRDEQGSWDLLESYLTSHSEARLSHTICPNCINDFYPDLDLDKT